MTFILTSHTAAAFVLGLVTVAIVALFTYAVRNFTERGLLLVPLMPFGVAWTVLFVLAFGAS